ncbi:kin of IRRE-like protein 2 [Penaeus japonicus]|uniref:kin of IRRE-like protein 2 n=1 Tax=Penaeus japonicus TaxID=27405 RepID=UPI001C715904|nr:kin of IRRE-like protein 2 [Penaeus japonicus]
MPASTDTKAATRQIRTLITGLLLFSWSEGCIGYQDESHVFLVVPESVQVRPGEDVFLKCVVRSQYTSVQWTKDGVALGYSRGVPGYPRYTYEGERAMGEHHLAIKGATSQDDGEFQCQAGPVPGIVSASAAANVTVLVPPGSISVAGRREETEMEVRAGDPLTLECLVRNARPAPSVAWYRSGLKLDPALHKEEVLPSGEQRQWNVKSRLVIRPSRDDDGRQFSCRALHPALERSPANLVASVVLDVLHAPPPPTITGYRTGEVLVLGDERTLSCEVVGGNPRPRVVWYRHGRPLKTVQASGKRRVGRTKGGRAEKKE